MAAVHFQLRVVAGGSHARHHPDRRSCPRADRRVTDLVTVPNGVTVPSGGLGLVLLILIILMLTGRPDVHGLEGGHLRSVDEAAPDETAARRHRRGRRHHVYLVPGFLGFASLGRISYFGHVRRCWRSASRRSVSTLAFTSCTRIRPRRCRPVRRGWPRRSPRRRGTATARSI